MARSYKALSVLLSYPVELVQQAAPELAAVLRDERLFDPAQIAALAPLIDALGREDLMDLQERYVALFDRNRSLSLHLFEHVHGESRDRGQALVDLRALYEQHGLEISATELPDYLPLYLEFLSMLPDAEALELLAQPGVVLAVLAERLKRRESIYAPVLDALATLAGAGVDAPQLAELLAMPEENPDDLAALDAAWESEQVGFGPGSALGATAPACGSAAGPVTHIPVSKISRARSTSNG